jgi:hypothetical protein
MAKSWVKSQYLLAQWNLRGGRLSNAGTKKHRYIKILRKPVLNGDLSIYPGRPGVKKSGSELGLPSQISSDADSFLFSVFRFEKQTSVGLQMHEGLVYTLWLLCEPAMERKLTHKDRYRIASST